MRVILAQPRGFCAGVVRAIEIVERALQKFGPPVYVRHEIVHNKHVVESLKAKGARFVEDLSEVPPNAVTIFSAHDARAKTTRLGQYHFHQDLPVRHRFAFVFGFNVFGFNVFRVKAFATVWRSTARLDLRPAAARRPGTGIFGIIYVA